MTLTGTNNLKHPEIGLLMYSVKTEVFPPDNVNIN